MDYLYIAIAGCGGILAGLIIAAIFQRARKTSAGKLAEQIKNDARKEAEHIQREAKVSAKSDILKMREEVEQELKERRKEQQNIEKRLTQKEEALERKSDQIDNKLQDIERQSKELTATRERLNNREQELQKKISEQIDQLERVAQLSRDEAREILLEKLKNEVKNESGLLVRDILEEAKQKAEKESRRILTYAIQRYSSDCTYERTTATIPLPNDEMKGRIIGREGRNIRALEAATGVNILIDDTPEAVVISCFDPIRKEVARLLIERLISDGRIHPTRIEELVKKITKEVEEDAFSAGEAAVHCRGVRPPESCRPSTPPFSGASCRPWILRVPDAIMLLGLFAPEWARLARGDWHENIFAERPLVPAFVLHGLPGSAGRLWACVVGRCRPARG